MEDQTLVGIINTITRGHRSEEPSGDEEVAKKWTGELITLIEKNAQGTQFPHNDVVVVNLNIANYDVRRILIDNGSSTDILFYDAFSKMGIPADWVERMDSPLIEFIGNTILVEGVITLSMKVG